MNTEYPIRSDMDKLLGNVMAEYRRQVSVADYFRKKCEDFRKDTEIKRLDDALERERRLSLHRMSEEEYRQDRDFRDQHYSKCKNGNRYQYELTGTGIGTCITVTCPICGCQIDITDTDSW